MPEGVDRKANPHYVLGISNGATEMTNQDTVRRYKEIAIGFQRDAHRYYLCAEATREDGANRSSKLFQQDAANAAYFARKYLDKVLYGDNHE